MRDSDQGFGPRLEQALLLLIVANVAAVIIESVPRYEQYQAWFRGFEVLSVAIFTAEYIVRLARAPADPRYRGAIAGRLRFMLSPFAVIDLLAILPFYLPLLIAVDLRVLRILRLGRLFRVAKMGRYLISLNILRSVLQAKKEELLVTLGFGALLLVVAACLMYYAEHDAQPDALPSIPAAMWWATATLTTVGYGDIYPVTAAGRLLAACLALLAIGLVSLPAGILAAGFSEALQRRRAGEGLCPHCGQPLDHSAAAQTEQAE